MNRLWTNQRRMVLRTLRGPAGLVLLLLLMLTAGAGVRGARAQEQATDVAAVDAAFKQALGQSDLDAVDALYAPDIVEVNPFGVFRGVAAVRGFEEQLGRQNPGLRFSFGETTVVDDTAVHRAFLSSDPIRAAGVSRIVVIHTLVVAQGTIVTLTAVLDLADPETAQFAAAMAGR